MNSHKNTNSMASSSNKQRNDSNKRSDASIQVAITSLLVSKNRNKINARGKISKLRSLSISSNLIKPVGIPTQAMINQVLDKNIPDHSGDADVLEDIFAGSALGLRQLLASYNSTNIHNAIGKYLLDLHTHAKNPQIKGAIYQYDMMKRLLPEFKEMGSLKEYVDTITKIISVLTPSTRKLLMNYVQALIKYEINPYKESISKSISGVVTSDTVSRLGKSLAKKLKGDNNILSPDEILDSKRRFLINVMSRPQNMDLNVLARQRVYSKMKKKEIKPSIPPGPLFGSNSILGILGITDLSMLKPTDSPNEKAQRILNKINQSYKNINKNSVKDKDKLKKIEMFIKKLKDLKALGKGIGAEQILKLISLNFYESALEIKRNYKSAPKGPLNNIS